MAIPTTARIYQELYTAITGQSYHLNRKTGQQFLSLSRTLRAAGIDEEQYIRFSVAIWESYAQQMGLPVVPPNLLCGERALARYEKQQLITPSDLVYATVFHIQRAIMDYQARARVAGWVDDMAALTEFCDQECHNLCDLSWKDILNCYPQIAQQAIRDAERRDINHEQ